MLYFWLAQLESVSILNQLLWSDSGTRLASLWSCVSIQVGGKTPSWLQGKGETCLVQERDARRPTFSVHLAWCCSYFSTLPILLTTCNHLFSSRFGSDQLFSGSFHWLIHPSLNTILPHLKPKSLLHVISLWLFSSSSPMWFVSWLDYIFFSRGSLISVYVPSCALWSAPYIEHI